MAGPASQQVSSTPSSLVAAGPSTSSSIRQTNSAYSAKKLPVFAPTNICDMYRSYCPILPKYGSEWHEEFLV